MLESGAAKSPFPAGLNYKPARNNFYVCTEFLIDRQTAPMWFHA